MNLAFFDVDQTLYRGYSNDPFLRYLTENVRPKDPLSKEVWQRAEDYAAGKMEYNQATQYFLEATGKLIAGSNPDEVRAWVRQLFPTAKLFFAWVEPVLDYLRSLDFRIYLISGSPAVVIEHLAELLGVQHYFATEFLLDEHGNYSGEITLMNHEAKRQKLLDLIKKITGNHQTIAFGDSPGDIPMLQAVDLGFVVEPKHNPQMVELSQENDWVVLKHQTALEQVKQALKSEFSIT